MNNLEQQRRQALLAWYDAHGRSLPWRAGSGEAADPYRIWLSEIMLQQTTVITVAPYFKAFVDRWPTLRDLAAADLHQVLHAWQGLGYYARARNLHKCAVLVAGDYGGQLPGDERELLKLPGIGPYTAAAIAAIAFGHPSAPVDGNIERVFARLLALDKPSPGLRSQVAPFLLSMVPQDRPGDFVQALMDLGATVCTPKNPKCDECPWVKLKAGGCRAFDGENAPAYPVKKPKKVKPVRHGVAFWAENGDGRVFLRRREERGLLGGMMEFPSTDWRQEPWKPREALTCAPFKADWSPLPGQIRHTFTHFHLQLTVCIGRVAEDGGVWSALDGLSDHALPTLMKKIVGHVGSARKKGKN